MLGFSNGSQGSRASRLELGLKNQGSGAIRSQGSGARGLNLRIRSQGSKNDHSFWRLLRS